MNRYILTGTPGCGKTSIINELEKKDLVVVAEAATDIIAHDQKQGIQEPWKHPKFIDDIVDLQRERQLALASESKNQFYDRSPICTYALAQYLNFTPSDALMEEIERIQENAIYQKQVFFIENLGFCSPTEARTISFEEALIFEKIHEEAYIKFGYECIKIPPMILSDRVKAILDFVG